MQERSEAARRAISRPAAGFHEGGPGIPQEAGTSSHTTKIILQFRMKYFMVTFACLFIFVMSMS